LSVDFNFQQGFSEITYCTFVQILMSFTVPLVFSAKQELQAEVNQ